MQRRAGDTLSGAAALLCPSRDRRFVGGRPLFIAEAPQGTFGSRMVCSEVGQAEVG